MTTAAQIIKQAMQDAGVLGIGKTPTSNDYTDILSRLNDLAETWSLDSLSVPFRTQVSKALNGSQSYTIGSGGDIDTTRPTNIESAFVRDSGGFDFPLRVIRDRTKYDDINDKSITGLPNTLYYEPSVPLGTIYLWYVGDSTYTLYMETRGQLTAFPDTSTDIDLAPGYKQAFIKNLAVSICPMFEMSATPELINDARLSLSAIRRLNRQIPIMDASVPAGNHDYYRIEEG